MSLDILAPETLACLAAHKQQFKAAQPFSHIVIDNFLRPAFCEDLLQEFPLFDNNRARNEDGNVGRKAVHQHISRIGSSYRSLDAVVQSPAFLDYMAELTSIPRLLHDPDYFGGGTHENLEGQDLDPHVDFTFHHKLRAHRRLNLIVYLNKDWETAWGGNIQFHRNPRLEPGQDEIITVAPLFNRAVVFETHNHSWHGFERISLPDGKKSLSRKSVALYFYTKQRELPIKPHSTIYVDRHLPPRFAAGMQLQQSDVDYLKVLLRRRDMHLERLYGFITSQMQRLERLGGLEALRDTREEAQQQRYENYERQDLIERLNDIESSLSWKLLSPLRDMQRVLAKVAGRLSRK